MHAPVDFFLREPAVSAGNQVLAADVCGEPRETLGDELGMFHHVRAVADDTGHENFSGRQLYLLPDFPFVLMTRVRRLQQIRACVHLQDQIDDLSERHVSRMWSWPA